LAAPIELAAGDAKLIHFSHEQYPLYSEEDPPYDYY